MLLTLEVRSDEEDQWSEMPGVATVHITEELARRIRRMAKILEESQDQLKLYSVSCFDYTPDWYSTIEFETCEALDNNVPLPEHWVEHRTLVRMDACTLDVLWVVDHAMFAWSGYEKHGTIKFRTQKVHLKELGVEE